MADDGGSTGILRAEAKVTPPGDIRKCLAAFAENPDDPFTKAFKYRFEFARNHTLGNLMLSALEEATGSFPEAVKICGKLLGSKGRVYPSTLNNVVLNARTLDGRTLHGQATACKSETALDTVWLESTGQPMPYVEAIRAIYDADFIVLGPGSLFTSIIPNLLVPGSPKRSNARRPRPSSCAVLPINKVRLGVFQPSSMLMRCVAMASAQSRLCAHPQYGEDRTAAGAAG